MNNDRSPSLPAVIGICSGCVVIALVFTMVNTAIPSIQSDLGLPFSSLQWMMTAFGLVNCTLLVTCGRIADIFGRKKVFLTGLFSSTTGMIIAGFSHGANGLILGMAFAGLGNAILLPVTQAMLVMEFPVEKKGQAIGLWAGCLGASMAVGPILGGVITSLLGWRSAYLINIPLILASFLLTLLFSRETRNEKDPAEVDVKGMFYLAVAVVSFVLASTEHQQLSLLALASLGLVGFAGVWLFVRHEKRFSSPIVSDQLWKNRAFLSSALACFCLIFFVWSIFFLLPLFLQKESGLSPMSSGLMMLSITLPVAFLSPLIPKLDWHGKTWMVIFTGFLLLALFSFTQMRMTGRTPLWEVAASSLVFGIGYSFIWGPAATIAVSCFPSHQSGIASGTFVTVQELGGMSGLAIIVSTFAHFQVLSEGYHASMAILLAVSILGCLLCLSMTRIRQACPSVR